MVNDKMTINLPPLSDYDIETEPEEEYIDNDSKVKTEKERTITWLPVSSPSQAKVTSEKYIKKRKVETVREGALLPDNIWLSNHMPCNRLSNAEFNANCKTLRESCISQDECIAHVSLRNLKVISGKMKKVLSQNTNLSTDWVKNKKLHSGKRGYLDLAINFPKIWDQTKLIKRQIKVSIMEER